MITPMSSLADACIVVPTCDAYHDVARVVQLQRRSMWPDCRLKTYAIGTRRPLDVPGVTTIATGEDRGWSANLRQALQLVPQPYVFLYIDDLFLTERVPNAEVEETLAWAMRARANYVRLHPYPPMDDRTSPIVEVPPGTAYRTATVMSFWRKQCLAELLADDESAWGFENAGSARSDAWDRFYATAKAPFRFFNLVIKGKLRRRAASIVARSGHDPARLCRERLSLTAECIQHVKDLRARLFWSLPQDLQRPVRDFCLGTGGRRS